VAQGQVPAVISVGIIAFVLGAGLGAFGMFYLKFDPKTQDARIVSDADPGAVAKGPPGGMKGGGGGGGPPGGKGKAGGPPGGMGRDMLSGMAANPKAQLVSLVGKLDALTTKPLSITLSDDQRTKLAELLKSLEPEEDMNDEEARRRLDDMLKIFEPGQKETLEAAGFGGAQMPRPVDASANPFAGGDSKEHLKKLSERLNKK
jgi:hypothetical protein